MSDLGNSNWSETDASNNATPPNGWPEGMNPSDVNDAARANMGALKRWWNRANATATTGGTSTAYTLTYTVAAAAYYSGEEFSFVVNATCGATPTLNVNALGAANLRKFSAGAYTNLAAGDILTNQVVRVRYNSSVPSFDLVTLPAFITQTQADNSTNVATTAYVDRVAVQQVQFVQSSTLASGTTATPFDNTIPQNTEGDQFMSLAITPKSATSKLLITVNVFFSASNAVDATVALFQDSTANALAAIGINASVNQSRTVSMHYEMVSGTTSATTFKVRVGGDGVVTIYFNGVAASQRYGGVANSSITIVEVGV